MSISLQRTAGPSERRASASALDPTPPPRPSLGSRGMNIAPARGGQTLPRFASIGSARSPVAPVYALFPEYGTGSSPGTFPGCFCDQANPAPHVFSTNHYAAGIRHFERPSLAENRERGSVPTRTATSWRPFVRRSRTRPSRNMGVRDRHRLLIRTRGIQGRSELRIATPLGGAVLELSSKFATRRRAFWLAVRSRRDAVLTFHVGSQSFAILLCAGDRGCTLTDGVSPRSTSVSFSRPLWVTMRRPITDRHRERRPRSQLPVMCEPGRALVAEGVSL